MALETARKYARECAPGSGEFPGQFEGANVGGSEEQSPPFMEPCTLAHPFRTHLREHPIVSRSRPRTHQTAGVSAKLWGTPEFKRGGRGRKDPHL
jgi:hypothetical protein